MSELMFDIEGLETKTTPSGLDELVSALDRLEAAVTVLADRVRRLEGCVSCAPTSLPMNPRLDYPQWLRALIEDDRLRAKAWPSGAPEPDWMFTLDLTAEPSLAPTGKIGLMTNHLHGADAYQAFGPIGVTPLNVLS